MIKLAFLSNLGRKLSSRLLLSTAENNSIVMDYIQSRTGCQDTLTYITLSGLTLTPGPIVEDTVTLRTYCPLAAAGLAFIIVSARTR